MLSSYKYCIGRDSVHKDASRTFKVVQVNVTVLGDNVDHIVPRSNLRKFWGEGIEKRLCTRYN